MTRSRLSVRTAVGDALALGFRRPVSVTVWGLVSFAGLIGLLALFCWGFTGFDAAPEDQSAGEVVAAMVRIQGASALLQLGALVMTAVLLAAVTRAVLGWRHGASLAFMRLGMDELRVLVIQIAIGIGLQLLIVPLVLIGVGIGLAVWPLEPEIRYAAIAATTLALVVFVIWIALRIVLIAPMTVAVHRFSFIEGWRITGGRVWRLLGIAILSTLACLVISILLLLTAAVTAHVAGFAGMVDFHALKDFDWSDHARGMDWDWAHGDWVRTMDWTAVGVVAAVAAIPLGWLSGMTLALSYAPWASAYRQIAADPESAPDPAPIQAPAPVADPVSASEAAAEPEPHPEPEPESPPPSEPEAPPPSEPEAGAPVADETSSAPESAVEEPSAAAEHGQPPAADSAVESHPVADAWDHDRVETREDPPKD